MSAEDTAGARSFAGLGVVDAISMVAGSVVSKVEPPDLRRGPHLTKSETQRQPPEVLADPLLGGRGGMRTSLLPAAALGAIEGGLSAVPTLAQLFIART